MGCFTGGGGGGGGRGGGDDCNLHKFRFTLSIMGKRSCNTKPSRYILEAGAGSITNRKVVSTYPQRTKVKQRGTGYNNHSEC